MGRGAARRTHTRDTRVVDQQVYLRVVLLQPPRKAPDRGHGTHVHVPKHNAAIPFGCRLDFCQSLQPRCPVPTGKDHTGAAEGQCLGHSLPDACGGQRHTPKTGPGVEQEKGTGTGSIGPCLCWEHREDSPLLAPVTTAVFPVRSVGQR